MYDVMFTVIVIIILIDGILALGALPFRLWQQYRQHQQNAKKTIAVKIGGCVLGGLVLLGCVQIMSWIDYWWYRDDRTEIDSTFIDFNVALSEGRTADAYEMMSPEYRNRHSVKRFQIDFSEHGTSTLYPYRCLHIFSGRAELDPDDAWDELASGPIYRWVKVDGKWYLTGEVEWASH